jgi:hypothetical protein
MMTINHPAPLPVSIAGTDLPKMIKGESAVGGFALAPAIILGMTDPLVAEIADEEFNLTLADFPKAMDETIGQLIQLQEKLTRRLPENAALIFEAHHMMRRKMAAGCKCVPKRLPGTVSAFT